MKVVNSMSTWKELKDNPRLKKIFEDRITIIKTIRAFFWSQGFLETDTPVAVKYPGQEPYLNPIPVTFHDPNGKAEKFYLHTSPEFSLKKLLAAGFKKIFHITKCFRDFESFGGNHNTEFTMIEWYRAPGTLTQIMDDTEAMFKYVGKELCKESVYFTNRAIPITGKWARVSMKEVWQKYVNVNLNNYFTVETLQPLVKELGYSVSDSDKYEDLFFKIFLNKIEPCLGFDAPVFIYDYPKQMSSLSKTCADEPRYAERFELYIGGLEIANAFGELTDPVDQKARLEEDKRLRTELGRETWPVDPSFIQALQSGIPEAGGIALGVDRMIVLFTEAKDINEVIFQSISDQLQ